MKIIKHVPAEKTFDLPAGQFNAVLTQVKLLTKQTKKGIQEWIRLLYEVEVPSLANQIPYAGRNFLLDLNCGSDLRNFLEVWLGSDFFAKLSNQDLDFDTLVGKEAVLKLSHFQSEEYEKPHVTINNAFPPGSLPLQEKAISISPALSAIQRKETTKV
jgi:hypothetical protein